MHTLGHPTFMDACTSLTCHAPVWKDGMAAAAPGIREAFGQEVNAYLVAANCGKLVAQRSNQAGNLAFGKLR